MYEINLHPAVQPLLHEEYRQRTLRLFQRVAGPFADAGSDEAMVAVSRLALLRALVKGRLAFNELDGLSALRSQQA